MTQDSTQEVPASGGADYDALYRGASGLDGVELSFDGVPWDIGGPQPAVVDLERTGEFHGSVLDAGCGPGDNAIFLARRGYSVTGVDASPTALETARERARHQGVEVLFVVDDATSLSNVTPGFDTVLDSTLYHCLGVDERQCYGAALHRVSRPGAILHLFCFADEGAGHFPAPLQVSVDDLRANLGPHWDIATIDLAWYVSRLTRRDLELLAVADTAFPAIDPATVEVDDQGRIRTPVWQLRARRRQGGIR